MISPVPTGVVLRWLDVEIRTLMPAFKSVSCTRSYRQLTNKKDEESTKGYVMDGGGITQARAWPWQRQFRASFQSIISLNSTGPAKLNEKGNIVLVDNQQLRSV